jgi:iron(III) transport system permease protein
VGRGAGGGLTARVLPSPWTAAAVVVAALVAVPIVAVVSALAQPVTAVWVHLWRTQLVELIVNTLALVAGVGIATLVIGTTLAWLVVAHEFPGRAVFEWALVLPLAVPAYVIGFVFLGLLDFAGPLQTTLRGWGVDALAVDPRSYWGVTLVMTLVFYPYVYLLARAAFTEQGAATLETARSLGRTRLGGLVSVVLPMTRPSLVAGTSLAMMEALADLGTVATFGYRTLTEGIYRVWYGLFDRTAAAQLATLLLFLALGLLAGERALRGRARFTQSQRRGPGLRRAALTGWRGWAAATTCAGVLTLGFLLPVGQLLAWLGEGDPGWDGDAEFGRTITRTVILAGGAAVLTCVLALLLGYATRLHPTAIVQGAARFASMGYALPGSVVAVGVLLPLAWVDHFFAWAAERALDHPAGLLLTGSAGGLLFAYVVRFLAIGYQTVEASLANIPASLDDAARSLGASVRATLARVHLPLIRGGLLTAFILVFVETMKEMPATLLLRPFGITTLAVEIWERTSESMWREAALPALALVVAGLGPVVIAIRLSARR